MSEALRDVACPAGDFGKVLGVVLSCYQQAVIVLLFGLVLPLACCLYCCIRFKALQDLELPVVARWSQRSEPAPLRAGQRGCGDFGRQSFSVVSKPTSRPRLKMLQVDSSSLSSSGPSSKGDLVPVSGKQSREIRVVPSQESKTQDEEDVAELPMAKSRMSLASAWSMFSSKPKVHVVWNLNLRQAQEWLAGKTSTLPSWSKSVETKGKKTSQDAFHGMEDLEEVRGAPSDGHELRPVLPYSTHSGPASGRGLWEGINDLALPAYTHSERVEYFSPTYAQWVLADVNVRLVHERSPPEAVYSVKFFRSARERHHVELECLRLPLRPGEHCELWCKTEEQWLPAVVVKMEAGSNAFRHYEVHLCGTDGQTATAQASLLRRRFVPGSAVQVYRGLQRGWVAARVAGAPASAASSCAELEQAQEVPEADEVLLERSSEELSADVGEGGGSRALFEADGSKLDCGVMVPVVEEVEAAESASASPELVPSYLVRFCPKAWNLLPEGHEDLEAVVSL